MRWPPEFDIAHLQQSVIREDSSLARKLHGNWVVTWYGRVGHPRNIGPNRSVPPVEVHLTRRDYISLPKAQPTLFLAVPLTYLDILRIGSAWSGPRCLETIRFEVETFDVSFDPAGWAHTSLELALNNGEPWAIEFANTYPLKYVSDWTWILRFRTAQGPHIFIPCLEFYTSMYGSSELRRILATYQWPEVKKRLLSKNVQETDEEGETDSWVVHLGKHLDLGDARLIAHIENDPSTRKLAQLVCSQLEAPKAKWNPLKIQPWWTGGAKLKVEGFWLNDSHDFIGLRIMGSSLPETKVTVIKHDSPDFEASDADQGKSVESGLDIRTRVRKNKAEPLTPDEAPDHSGSIQFIDLREFEVLGNPAPIMVVREAATAETSGGSKQSVVECGERALSTDEAYGNGKGVGKAILTAKKKMESEGMLREMWIAANNICRKVPQVFSVLWYDADSDSFRAGEPQLVQVEPDLPASQKRGWAYLDGHEKRGFLVMRIETNAGIAYIIELQRRIIGKQKEEAFKGLVFQLDESGMLDWIHLFARLICRETGRMDKVVRHCPGKAFSFKHSKPKDLDTTQHSSLCETAVMNALRKVGIHLVRRKKSKK